MTRRMGRWYLVILLSVLMGLVQALVFSLLTAIYFTEAGEVEEGEELTAHD